MALRMVSFVVPYCWARSDSEGIAAPAVDLAADSSANTQVQRKMRGFSVFVEPWCAAVALRHAGTSFRTRRLQSIVNTVLHDMPKSSGT